MCTHGPTAKPCLAAGLWSLDDGSDPVTAAVLEEATAAPERFVLKPQV